METRHEPSAIAFHGTREPPRVDLGAFDLGGRDRRRGAVGGPVRSAKAIAADTLPGVYRGDGSGAARGSRHVLPRDASRVTRITRIDRRGESIHWGHIRWPLLRRGCTGVAGCSGRSPSHFQNAGRPGGAGRLCPPMSSRYVDRLQAAMPWAVGAWIAGVILLSLWNLCGWIAAQAAQGGWDALRECGAFDSSRKPCPAAAIDQTSAGPAIALGGDAGRDRLASAGRAAPGFGADRPHARTIGCRARSRARPHPPARLPGEPVPGCRRDAAFLPPWGLVDVAAHAAGAGAVLRRCGGVGLRRQVPLTSNRLRHWKKCGCPGRWRWPPPAREDRSFCSASSGCSGFAMIPRARWREP